MTASPKRLNNDNQIKEFDLKGKKVTTATDHVRKVNDPGIMYPSTMNEMKGLNVKRFVSTGPLLRKQNLKDECTSKRAQDQKENKNSTFQSYVNKIASGNIAAKRTSHQTKIDVVHNTNVFSRRKSCQRGGSVNRRDIHFKAKLAVTPIDFINQRLDTPSKMITPMPFQSEWSRMN